MCAARSECWDPASGALANTQVDSSNRPQLHVFVEIHFFFEHVQRQNNSHDVECSHCHILSTVEQRVHQENLLTPGHFSRDEGFVLRARVYAPTRHDSSCYIYQTRCRILTIIHVVLASLMMTVINATPWFPFYTYWRPEGLVCRLPNVKCADGFCGSCLGRLRILCPNRKRPTCFNLLFGSFLIAPFDSNALIPLTHVAYENMTRRNCGWRTLLTLVGASNVESKHWKL